MVDHAANGRFILKSKVFRITAPLTWDDEQAKRVLDAVLEATNKIEDILQDLMADIHPSLEVVTRE